MEVLKSQKHPATVDSLTRDLRSLGVAPGTTLLVHSSMRAVGFVVGGPVALVQALEQCLEPEGTLVMPTHTSDLSDPQYWSRPPVPPEWWDRIRHEAPAFDPAWTPSRRMGALVECFRTQPGTLRSAHPHVSFAARGRHADRVTAAHPLDAGLGDGSPVGEVYVLDGHVLLIGLGYGHNSSLHLAERRAAYPGKRMQTQGASVLRDGRPQWVEFLDVDWDDGDFPAIAEEWARASGLARHGKVGEADAVLMPQRALVDYAVAWMEKNRGRQTTGDGRDETAAPV